MRNFKKLIVWQRAHVLAIELADEADLLPRRHRYLLGNQLLRAAASVPANIAEGAGRDSVKERRRFLTIALGSIAEVEDHLLLARDLKLLSKTKADHYLDEVEQVRRMMLGLRRAVR